MMTPLSKVLQWIEENKVKEDSYVASIVNADALAAYVQSLMGEEKQMCRNHFEAGYDKSDEENNKDGYHTKSNIPNFDKYFSQSYEQKTAN